MIRISDILCLMFVIASQKSRKSSFLVRCNDLQRMLRSVRSSLTQEIIFSDSGPMPFSPIVEQAFYHLLFSGLISYIDTQDPGRMFLRPAAFEYAQVLKAKISQTEIKEVEKLAEEFLSVKAVAA